jgi:hypothetical protein
MFHRRTAEGVRRPNREICLGLLCADNAPLEPPLIPLIFIVKTNTCKHYTHIANTHTAPCPPLLCCLKCINTQQRRINTHTAPFFCFLIFFHPHSCSSSPGLSSLPPPEFIRLEPMICC